MNDLVFSDSEKDFIKTCVRSALASVCFCGGSSDLIKSYTSILVKMEYYNW